MDLTIEQLFANLARAVETGESIDRATGLALLTVPADRFPMVMGYANEMRLRWCSNRVTLCSIMNARSGACSEDCSFCAQSAHHSTKTAVYSMRDTTAIRNAYESATENPISRFGVVTSGEGLSEQDIDELCRAVSAGEKPGTHWCSSLGIQPMEQLLKLKTAGVKRFHHNLETCESFFPQICTTHTWRERFEMAKRVKEAGLEICCGGIIGLGESHEQRWEFADQLRQLGVDSIPMNFLISVEGTRLQGVEPMLPMDILRAITLFRFVNPRSEIKVAAGRVHLRDLQSMIFYAGASSMMVGDLLTVAARGVTEDMQMLTDLEVVIAQE